ncbi:MAG: helix-hairpin-helix domain-containing protein [Lachnospiraceae bacterium]|nr:helix-hairpin-helix domain-containing protein [Lachnospiraceae bacterium]
MKTVIIGLFVAASGVCYSFFMPKEEINVEVIRGDTDVTATTVTSTPVPTPTDKPEGTLQLQEGSNSAPAGSGSGGNSGGKQGASGSGGEQSAGGSGGEQGKVNINTAGEAELMTLPGIGSSRAKWIVEYRSKNGPFQKIEDIMLVKGIKEGIFGKIRDRISVD